MQVYIEIDCEEVDVYFIFDKNMWKLYVIIFVFVSSLKVFNGKFYQFIY